MTERYKHQDFRRHNPPPSGPPPKGNGAAQGGATDIRIAGLILANQSLAEALRDMTLERDEWRTTARDCLDMHGPI